ncbi:MAG TPA: YkvA family protein [Ktedonobacterales bacterium]|nr:YkvA family protein [Ktedonobacterales bacterium]
MLDRMRKRAQRLKTEIYTLYLAYRDPRTPWYARLFVAGVVAYAFSPLDLIPDFIPVLGFLDDLILVPLGIVLALRMIPAPVMTECRQRAAETLREGRPTNWLAAGVIIAIWLALAALLVVVALRLLTR